MRKEAIYMAVTADELELPLFVGFAQEVAEWAGINVATLYGMISHKKSGKRSGRKFVKVEM